MKNTKYSNIVLREAWIKESLSYVDSSINKLNKMVDHALKNPGVIVVEKYTNDTEPDFTDAELINSLNYILEHLLKIKEKLDYLTNREIYCLKE